MTHNPLSPEYFEQVIQPLPGWSSPYKAHRIACLVYGIGAETSVEIGVYGGRSFLGMAIAHKVMAKGTAIAIDPWSNAAAVEGYTGENKVFWENNPLEQIYNGFVRLMRETETSPRVRIVREKSDNVVPPEQIDVLSIDGLHTAQAIRDAIRFGSHVRTGGFCIMDDLEWANDGKQHVMDAVAKLTELGFQELYRVKESNTWAVYQLLK